MGNWTVQLHQRRQGLNPGIFNKFAAFPSVKETFQRIKVDRAPENIHLLVPLHVHPQIRVLRLHIGSENRAH